MGCVFGKWLAHKSRIILQQGYKNRWENSSVKKTKQLMKPLQGWEAEKTGKVLEPGSDLSCAGGNLG